MIEKQRDSVDLGVAGQNLQLNSLNQLYQSLDLGRATAARQMSEAGYAYPLNGPAEYRGWYRITGGADAGKALWCPKWSKFDGPRPDGPHQGADLYSHGRERLIAIADGTIEFRPYSSTWGHHIYLYFKIGGVTHIAVYAHIDKSSSFSGLRTVKKGDIIGTAGCSGNAGNNDACWRDSLCHGKVAVQDHLHLEILKIDIGGTIDARLDPVSVCGWTVTYHDDSSQDVCGKETQLI